MKVSMAPIQKLFSKNVQQPNLNTSSSGKVDILLSNNERNRIVKTLQGDLENLKKKLQKVEKEISRLRSDPKSDKNNVKIAALSVQSAFLKEEIKVKNQEIVYWKNQPIDSFAVSQASQETAIYAQEENSDILQLESIHNVLENATDAVLKGAADTGTSGPTFLERLYQFIMNLLSKLFPNLVPAQVSNLA